MKKKISLCILIGIIISMNCLSVKGQIADNYWQNLRYSYAASSNAECEASLKFCNEILQFAPNHPIAHYLAARLNEQLGNRNLAIDHLKKAVTLGYTSNINVSWYVHPKNDPAFFDLRKSNEYREIYGLMQKTDEVIHNSEIAFIVDDERMGYYEGITYDPVDKFFYLGSDHNIFKVDHIGKSEVFTKNAQEDGLQWINGIHVDSERRTLWACSNNNQGRNATIFKYNIASGKLIKKYPAPTDGNGYMFNDLVIHPNGDVYISGSRTLFKIPFKTDTLEYFFKDDSFVGSNGITISDDGHSLFVAEGMSICKIDINTKSYIRLTHDQEFNTMGIDGIYFKDNYLYAIHNTLIRTVNRFKLSSDETHVESCEYFEKNTPLYGTPCTGVLVDDYFYFLAGYNIHGVIVMKVKIY